MKRKRKRKHSMLRKLMVYGGYLSVILIVLFILFIFAVNQNVFGHLYSEQELRDFKNEVASVILSEEGKPIGKVFTENRTNVSFEEIPEHLKDALVATEDARYFSHSGVDTRSLLRVLFKTVILRQRSAGGGSTLNQQLSKNIIGRSGPMIINKTKEALMGQRLEKVYSKEDILTLYFNTVPFGENIFGIEAAAQRFFNKEVKDLNIQESAVLVGLLKANTYYNPRLHPENAISRRNVVLGQMQRYKYIDKAVADSLMRLTLDLDYLNLDAQGPANYYLVQVKREARYIFEQIEKETGKVYDLKRDGLIVTTSLDLQLQKYALAAYHEHLSVMQKRLRKQYASELGKQQLLSLSDKELVRLGLTDMADQKRNVYVFDWDSSYTDNLSIRDSIIQSMTLLHAGFVALDPATGAIKAYIGGIDFNTQPYDQNTTRRQLASTFKPILYLTALEQGMSPCDYLENDFNTLKGYPDWQPENYDKTTGGFYSMSGALKRSMNIPTVNLFTKVKFKALDELWHRLGFAAPLKEYPSTALGTGEASVFELALAYAAIANGGYKLTPNAITSIKTASGEVIYENQYDQERQRVISEQNSRLMTAMLEKVIDEGTGTSMRSRFGVEMSLAGKTGTSQDYSDAWFVAFNPKLIIATRVGASSAAIHFNTGTNGAGSTLALPLTAITLKQVQDNRTLNKKYAVGLTPLNSTLSAYMNCEDFKERVIIKKDRSPVKREIQRENNKDDRKKKKKKRKG
ncbi:MAG: transglycosylase domain-containing protein [Bacteroidetes bacterium]|nr:transglycosylase domain-containing protein [Bacteroidota bacterium]